VPRYHFNFRDGRHLVSDADGADFDTFELAYEEAFSAAREMWQDRLLRHEDPRNCTFEITDAAGTVLTVVPFAEVLDACRPGPRASMSVVEAEARIERARTLSRELGELLEVTRQSVARSRALLLKRAASF